MKLYYSPGACSLSPHIVLCESGLKFDLERVHLKTHETAPGVSFYGVNPKGYVPTLQLDDGQVLTEGPAIVQYIADQKPESKLVPAAGSFERYRSQEWLNFISTELHRSFSPLFNAATPEPTKQAMLEKLNTRFEFVAKSLEGKQYLMGDHFTAPDAYLFVMLLWTRRTGPDTARWPALKAFYDRVLARPAVKAAMDAEGLKN